MRLLPFLSFLLLPFFLPAQLLNGEFTEWNEPFETSAHEGELIDIGVINPKRGTPTNWQTSRFGVCRIESGCANGFGAILYSQYHGDPAFLMQTFPVNANATKLTGCYKSILYDINDLELIRYVNITARKNNEIIGSGQWSFESTDEYTSFEVPIIYNSPEIADSITIAFHSDVTGSINFPMDGLIFLDGIELDFATNNTETPALHSNDFHLYPNPITHNLFIGYEGLKNCEFEIYNLKGQLLKKGKLPQKNNPLDLSNFDKGLYLFNIIENNGQRQIGKFLKL